VSAICCININKSDLSATAGGKLAYGSRQQMFYGEFAGRGKRVLTKRWIKIMAEINLSNRKILIMIEELYNEFEVVYPYYRLLETGAQTILAGSEAKVYKGRYGLPMSAVIATEKLSAEELDGIIIPGVFAPDFMRRITASVELVRELFQHGKLVASICHGAWMLASAHIAAGKKLTSFFAIKDDLIHAGGLGEDSAVVVDGNLITSRKPEDLPAFMAAVVHWLEKH
jgi:protease I